MISRKAFRCSRLSDIKIADRTHELNGETAKKGSREAFLKRLPRFPNPAFSLFGRSTVCVTAEPRVPFLFE